MATLILVVKNIESQEKAKHDIIWLYYNYIKHKFFLGNFWDWIIDSIKHHNINTLKYDLLAGSS